MYSAAWGGVGGGGGGFCLKLLPECAMKRFVIAGVLVLPTTSDCVVHGITHIRLCCSWYYPHQTVLFRVLPTSDCDVQGITHIRLCCSWYYPQQTVLFRVLPTSDCVVHGITHIRL